jgi:hypothetical protein
VKERIFVVAVMLCVKKNEEEEKTRATRFGFDFLLNLLGLNLSHQMFFLHMALIHAINDLNGDIIKLREPELSFYIVTWSCKLSKNISIALYKIPYLTNL